MTILAATEGEPAPFGEAVAAGAGRDQARIVFVGEYDRSVDGNGRLALPSTFRDALGDRCYVTRDPEGCLAVTSVESFDARADEILDKVRRRQLPASATRSHGVSSSLVSIDKQGRITLDDDSRRHAGLNNGGTVVIAGALDCLQIWRPSRFRVIRSEDDVREPVRPWNDDDDTATNEHSGGPR